MRIQIVLPGCRYSGLSIHFDRRPLSPRSLLLPRDFSIKEPNTWNLDIGSPAAPITLNLMQSESCHLYAGSSGEGCGSAPMPQWLPATSLGGRFVYMQESLKALTMQSTPGSVYVQERKACGKAQKTSSQKQSWSLWKMTPIPRSLTMLSWLASWHIANKAGERDKRLELHKGIRSWSLNCRSSIAAVLPCKRRVPKTPLLGLSNWEGLFSASPPWRSSSLTDHCRL